MFYKMYQKFRYDRLFFAEMSKEFCRNWRKMQIVTGGPWNFRNFQEKFKNFEEVLPNLEEKNRGRVGIISFPGASAARTARRSPGTPSTWRSPSGAGRASSPRAPTRTRSLCRSLWSLSRSALCRSRRELSNAYLLANVGFDTAENEPCKVCPLSVYRSPRCHT